MAAGFASVTSFADQNPEPVLELDLDGRIVYSNPAARTTFPDREAFARSPLLDGLVPSMVTADGGSDPDRVEMEWQGRVFRRSARFSPDRTRVRVYLYDLTRARRDLGRREAILSAVSYSATEVLRAEDPADAIPAVLARLGEATGASRVYAFANSGLGSDLRIHPRGEWVANGVAPQQDNDALEGALYRAAGFERWRTVLETGGVIRGAVRDMPPSERPLLEAQGIRSILVVPVHAGDVWWGFLGFDACHTEREWHGAEIDALRAVCDTLGLALQRRSIEASLRESEARFRVIFEKGNDAIFVHGARHAPGGRAFREVNEVACRMLGYRRDELVGLTPDDILFDIPPDGERVDTSVLDPGEGFMVERTLASSTGEPIPVEINARVLRVEDERLVVSIARDIRERKQAEAALARSQAQLQQAQKMEAVGRLAGGVAHDFNNLLTGIKGTAELLLEEMDASSETFRDIEEILSTADRAASLTGQLLSFSRRQLIEPVDVNLAEVLQDTERMLRRLLGEPVDLSVDIDPDLHGIRMGSGQIEQILVNLAINARDAMPEGGRLHIAAANREVCGAGEAGLEPGRYVRIAVRDTGTGMDDTTLQRVFEPFFTTKKAGRGTGLGLSTVYGIVQQADGAIDVDSEPGRGTTFTLLLPAISLDAPSEPAVDEPRSRRGRGERVLLVEDEAAVALLVQRVLDREGYEIVVAESGEEAVACAGPPPDLVLTDVVLPGLSGREVAETLRQRWPGLPVIYMSGYSADEVSRYGVDEARHFLQKPFSPRGLLQTIQRALDRSSQDASV